MSVTDTDGVASREPYRVSLAVVKDEVPQVAVRLAGISTAITPDAILPFVGKITDDYGLDRAWFEYQVDATPAATKARSPAAERRAHCSKRSMRSTRARPTPKRANARSSSSPSSGSH